MAVQVCDSTNSYRTVHFEGVTFLCPCSLTHSRGLTQCSRGRLGSCPSPGSRNSSTPGRRARMREPDDLGRSLALPLTTCMTLSNFVSCLCLGFICIEEIIAASCHRVAVKMAGVKMYVTRSAQRLQVVSTE